MDHFEMVEKLREKASVSYEEASAALEKCNWDLLDALLLLESEGKLNPGSRPEQTQGYTTRPKAQEKKKEGHGGFALLMHGLAQAIKRLNSVQLLVKKHDEERLSLPMTVVLLLLVFVFWFALIAAVLAMVLGYRFAIKGLSFDDSVNEGLDKAGKFVNNVAKAGPTVVVIDHQRQDDQSDDGTVE